MRNAHACVKNVIVPYILVFFFLTFMMTQLTEEFKTTEYLRTPEWDLKLQYSE